MQNYMRKIMALWESGRVPRNTFSCVIIRHDDWCRLFRGIGECNCDPDVEVVKPLPFN